MNDTVKHPSHYCKGGLECIDAIKAIVSTIADPFEAYCTGNIVKYIWRWNDKNGVEDLQKAIRYIDFIEQYRASKQSEEPFEMGEEDVSEPFDSMRNVCGATSVALGEPVKGKYEGLSGSELRRANLKFCMSFDDCCGCPLDFTHKNGMGGCCKYELEHPEEFQEIVIKWLEEHEN